MSAMRRGLFSFVNGDCWLCIHLDLKVVQSKGTDMESRYTNEKQWIVNVSSSLNFPTLKPTSNLQKIICG